ncbi:TRAMP complex RNA-binding subunit Ecym_7460 [Eremothecium cymbalariae DBVPG|uniref:CCHC-type domain-containing protein n=1 Tax=Eremothecium cymbalariae (strain CBS 270.75 / DBVPG 7215 / KCTC 17166 / NRRL Y-17582) TaxID=931890 RepID=G8JWR4_ERECY|nr:hypothetical protein Ecym_7460 [Eremothecium cymbalariae DBVPG\
MSALSEIESHDGLPFYKDKLPSFKDEEKLVAPSIEEVDNDPELLRNLRGHGRYFAVDDNEDGIREEEPKCKNCSQRGHIKKNCPHVICSYCGSMDDHYSQHCPRTMRCSHCNESGHYRQHCPQKWKRIFCTLCNSKKHSRDRCPSIWRSYCLLGSSQKRVLPSHKIYCYNCAGKGHFGDDCPIERSSRVPNDDGSAFSGDNLASELRREYFSYLSKLKRESRASYGYVQPQSQNGPFGHRPARETRDDQDDYDYEGEREEEDKYAINYDDYEVEEVHYNPKNKNNKKSRWQDGNSNGYSRYNSTATTPQSNKNSLPTPASKGKLLQPPKKRRKHPLDFPRGGGGTANTSRYNQNINTSRYAPPAPYQNDLPHRNYNSYQPFRSGTLSRRR